MEKEKSVATKVGDNIGNFLGTIIGWFVAGLFLWWGWNVIVAHFGAPCFTYWEIVGMRAALGCIVAMFKNS